MRGYVPGEQTRDPKILKLNTNENPYPPSPLVGKVLCDLSADSLRLYPDPICRDLREMLAGLHGCSPDQILVGNGSDEVLALCLRAFVERDAEVGFFTPSYSLYPVLAAIHEQDDQYGRCDLGKGTRIQIEFVSSNPTGPLHVGHGRGGAVGDSTANILSFCGFDVQKEYYINDSGRQIQTLGIHYIKNLLIIGVGTFIIT